MARRDRVEGEVVTLVESGATLASLGERKKSYGALLYAGLSFQGSVLLFMLEGLTWAGSVGPGYLRPSSV